MQTPDLEAVIKGTEICLSGGLPDRCVECPYHHNGCDHQRMKDSLTLLRLCRLKAPFAMKPKWQKKKYFMLPTCGECGHNFNYSKGNRPNFCPNCGRAIDWEGIIDE